MYMYIYGVKVWTVEVYVLAEKEKKMWRRNGECEREDGELLIFAFFQFQQQLLL